MVAGIAPAIAIVSTQSSAASFSSVTTADNQATASSDDIVCDSAKQDAGYITLPTQNDAHYFY